MTNPAARSMTSPEWALLLALSVLWGGSFFFTEVALRALQPPTIVALRVAVAALVLNLLLPALGRRMTADPRVWAAFLGMGLLNNVLPFSLISWGQTATGSALASILNATTPLFGVLAAHALTPDEKLTRPRLAGVLLGFAGVVAIVGPAGLSVLGQGGGWAELAILGGALSYGFAGIFGRRFKRMGVDPIVTAAGQVSASTLVLLPLALVVDRPWTLPAPGAAPVAAVLGLAVASTALAYVLYFRILATAGATNLLLVTFLIPVSAIGLGTAVLGERLGARHVLGMALIGLGLAAIDGRPLRALRRPPASDPGVFQGRDI